MVLPILDVFGAYLAKHTASDHKKESWSFVGMQSGGARRNLHPNMIFMLNRRAFCFQLASAHLWPPITVSEVCWSRWIHLLALYHPFGEPLKPLKQRFALQIGPHIGHMIFELLP